jgi:phage antirepressor YoqD-like protein
MKPKADYFDDLVERNLLTSFRDTAKELKIKEKVFIDWLIGNGYIYRDKSRKLCPYAQYVNKLFELKEWKNEVKAGNQTLVTPRGRETFRLLLIKDGLVKETEKVSTC